MANNPNKKISKKIPRAFLIATVMVGVLSALYVVTMEPHKKEQQNRLTAEKAEKLKDAETGNEEAVKKMVMEQIESAVREQEKQESRNQSAAPPPPSPRSDAQETGAPSLKDRLPSYAPPPPPNASDPARVFDEEMDNAVQATTTPEIFDFSTPVRNAAPSVSGSAAPAGGQGATETSGETPSSVSIDDDWRSPPSPVSGPQKAPSKYLLQEGAVIDVVLMTQVNTQNPGRVQFRVVSDVYDSLGGRHLLIPKGTKLMGRYGQPSSFGLDRVPISLTRAVFSGGRSITLKDTDISDAMGAVGAPSEFHSNIWRAIGPGALVAWIGFKVDEALSEKLPTSATGSTTSAQSVSQSTIPEIQKRILQRYGAAKPYYTKDSGERLSIFVASDIAIPPEH